MAYRIQQRRDTAARWAEMNPILLDGEMGLVTDNPNQYKIGDGVHTWNELPLRGYTGTIAQTLGNNENAVASQKVVTEKFTEQDKKLSDIGSEVGGVITNTFKVIKGEEHSSSEDRLKVKINKGSSYIVKAEGVGGTNAILYVENADTKEIVSVSSFVFGSDNEYTASFNVSAIGLYYYPNESGNIYFSVKGGFKSDYIKTEKKVSDLTENQKWLLRTIYSAGFINVNHTDRRFEIPSLVIGYNNGGVEVSASNVDFGSFDMNTSSLQSLVYSVENGSYKILPYLSIRPVHVILMNFKAKNAQEIQCVISSVLKYKENGVDEDYIFKDMYDKMANNTARTEDFNPSPNVYCEKTSVNYVTLDAQGNLITEDRRVSDYIYCHGEKYISTNNGVGYICFYDKTYNFVSSVDAISKVAEIPSSAYFVRLVFNRYKSTGYAAFVNNPNLTDADYVPFGSDYIYNIIDDAQKSDVSFSSNIFDMTRAKKYKSLGADGRLEDLDRCVSDFILCKGRKNVSTDYGSGYVCFYNSKRQFVSSVPSSEKSIAIPAEAVYLRLTMSMYRNGYAAFIDNPNLKESDYIPFGLDGFYEYLLPKTWNSPYCVKDIDDKIAEFCRVFGSCGGEVESFLWFSDPHIYYSQLKELDREEVFTTLMKAYNSTPTDFSICGGDWLSGPLKDDAMYQLGLIDGVMNKHLSPYYPAFGNHDNNQDGKLNSDSESFTGELDDNVVTNLQYRRWGKRYYTFKGNNTKFFVLDSGTELDTSMNAYRWKQIDWLGKELEKNSDEHLILHLHIVTNTGSNNFGENVASLANDATLLIDAFNKRGSITLNGISYNFSESIGVVHCVLCGHVHSDNNAIINNVPVISITNLKNSYIGEIAFDLAILDYENKLLRTVRVGKGNNREIAIL